jgi:hypothetical protein
MTARFRRNKADRRAVAAAGRGAVSPRVVDAAVVVGRTHFHHAALDRNAARRPLRGDGSAAGTGAGGPYFLPAVAPALKRGATALTQASRPSCCRRLPIRLISASLRASEAGLTAQAASFALAKRLRLTPSAAAVKARLQCSCGGIRTRNSPPSCFSASA